MNISAAAGQTVRQVSSPTTVSASGWIGSSSGPLSVKELGALRAATGENFTWPPTATSGIPLVALEVADRHAAEMAAGMKMKELTAKDLQLLGAVGLLDADGVARGVAHLQQGSAPADGSSASTPTATPPKPVSGTVATDGSVYL